MRARRPAPIGQGWGGGRAGSAGELKDRGHPGGRFRLASGPGMTVRGRFALRAARARVSRVQCARLLESLSAGLGRHEHR